MQQDQWHDAEFASHWDQTTRIGNPTRDEQVDILLSLITDTYQKGTAILDLGIGSGLIEEQLFARLPDAYVVGIESSQAMIDLVRQRLAPFTQHYQIIHRDLADLATTTLPGKTYQIIFSAQVLHHLPQDKQRTIFQSIYTRLPPGGIFLLMDRVTMDKRCLELYRSVWQRLERVSDAQRGWDDLLQHSQEKGDYPASLEQLLSWLDETGFAAACLHLYLNRVVLAGIKPSIH